MQLQEAIGKRLYHLSLKYGMTYYELSKVSGVPRSTIQDIASGKSKSTAIRNLERISEGFGINLRIFFDDELFDYILD